MNRWPRRLVLGLALPLLLGGCGEVMSAPRESTPRVRCLNQGAPGAPGDSARPLVFLFCVQSP